MIFAGYQIEKIILLLLDIYFQNSFYDKNGNYIKEIVIGKFNNIKISPDSRILALCGFGSLNGDVEYYNLENYELIGKSNFFSFELVLNGVKIQNIF